MSQLRNQRKGHRGHIKTVLDKADALLLNDPLTKHQKFEMDGLIAVISNKLSVITNLDERILNDDATDCVTEMADIENHTVEYHRRLGMINSQLADRQTSVSSNPSSSPLSQQSSASSSTQKSYKLPKLTPKKFTGVQLDWVSFKDDFYASVHENSSIADVTKLRYLRSCVEGVPLRAIEGLPLTGNNYTAALKILEDRYADSEINTEAHINALWEIIEPSDDPSSLLTFYDTIENHIRALKSLGKTDKDLGELFTPLIKRRLPRSVRVQLTRTRGSSTWDFAQFREALFNEIKARCDGDFTTHSQSSKITSAGTLPSTAAFAVNIQPRNTNLLNRSRSASPGIGNRRWTPTRSSCPYCKNTNHRANECRVIKNAEERLDILIRDKLCINCTGSHTRLECRSTRTCVECDGQHHSSLHEAFAKRTSQPPREEASATSARATLQRTSSPNRATVTLSSLSETQGPSECADEQTRKK